MAELIRLKIHYNVASYVTPSWSCFYYSRILAAPTFSPAKYDVTNDCLVISIKPGIELYCNTNKIPIHRAYAYTTPITEDAEPDLSKLIECQSLFNSNNISTQFEDMWCTNFVPGAKFCNVVMELAEPTEITSE